MRTADVAAMMIQDSNGSPPPSAVGAEPVLVKLSDVQPEPIRWLWPGRIALGKLTLIAGDPNLGKSFLTLDIAARVSQGAGWPDAPDAYCAPAGVVLLSAEDDLNDTIRPRLDAAGADVDRIVALQGMRERNPETGEWYPVPFTLADLGILETAIDSVSGCRLVVIDPVSAYLGLTDSHKNAEVRAVLAPLAELAARRRLAVVAVTHLRKGEGPALYRAMGSLAFVAAARAVWAVARDPKDPTKRRRLFLPAKNNIAPDPTGLAYTLEPAENGTAYVAWAAEPVQLTADEALAPPPQPRGRGPVPAERTAATEWLGTLLADGPVPVDDVRKAAREAGLSWATVRRGQEHLGVRAWKRGFNPTCWLWELPNGSAEDAQVPTHTENLSTFGKPERLRAGAIENGVSGGVEEGIPAEDAQVSSVSTFGGEPDRESVVL